MTDLAWLDEQLEPTSGVPQPANDSVVPPWRGGWIGYLSYDLGRTIEPRAQWSRPSKNQSDWPLYEWLWCPEIFIHEATTASWYRADLQGASRIEAAQMLALLGISSLVTEGAAPSPCLEPWRAARPRSEITSAVGRAIEYIRAGDIFQANIAQQFTSRLKVTPRQLAAAAWEAAPNWYGAYLELAADRQVLSLSPELFLEVDRVRRRIVTRPLKGTLEASGSRSSLESSEKDKAELNMIVDLMRNDLGRICTFGTVRVTQPRAIESHPTVHHGVATIEGGLRERIGFTDIVRATFPAGSITGAPKIRAMQIIDELEPFARGPYCGSIGYVGATQVALNVAIRSMMIENGQATYDAGAGIVADSLAEQECDEMIAKTAVVRGLAGDKGDDLSSPAEIEALALERD